MHLFDVSKNFYGGNAIVSSHLPLAVGMALASKKRKTIPAVFLAKAAAEGEFHEAMNLAALGSCVICL
jgi:TPP-dependent pyruvate/acetoin dehydrogenase alpha subunit